MPLETVSAKRNRVYQRAFDHEEAQRLRGEGWSLVALADHFRVTPGAVDRVTNPVRYEQMAKQSLAWLRRQKEPCKGGCGTLVWTNDKKRTGFCIACAAKLRTTSVRPDTLRCSRCREWKPDTDFPNAKAQRSRRFRHALCRECNTIQRRETRAKNPEREQTYQRKYARERRGTMSTFVVLTQNGAGWIEVARVEAGSAPGAIEKAVTEPGEYVAITEGHMRPLKVEAVQALKVVRT